ncbi:MAG: hypothetical protein LUG55_09295, partial [Clostridiales bacterium]|nr:hypothetical protein [Clostridiales bacterium]
PPSFPHFLAGQEMGPAGRAKRFSFIILYLRNAPLATPSPTKNARLRVTITRRRAFAFQDNLTG